MPGGLNTVSLFSGAMGLDLGLEAAGYDMRACVEYDAAACETIRVNRPGVHLVEGDIRAVNPADVLSAVGLEPEELFLIAGGPPCQAFSTAGKRGSFGDPRGSLFADFVRFVEYMRPRYFLMENVRGLLSAAMEHRPLSQRGHGKPELRPEERLGSALQVILSEFDRVGYTVSYRLLNAADYGVPQNRMRVILLGSRDGEILQFPRPTHDRDGVGLPKWRTLGDALDGLDDPEPQYPAYSPSRARWFEMVPPGGNWRTLPTELQEEALGGAYRSGGGRVGFFRRLSFDKASPTIITSVSQKASGMCHPEETRPLSVKECQRVQQFPDGFEFRGSMAQRYTQVGNAVPVGLGEAVGRSLVVQSADGEYDGVPGERPAAEHAEQLELV